MGKHSGSLFAEWPEEFDPAGHNSRPDPVPLRPRESRNSLLGLEPAEMCSFPAIAQIALIALVV